MISDVLDDLDSLEAKKAQEGNTQIELEIGDFLGFVDMNEEDALTSDQVEKLEGYVLTCQEHHAAGHSLVSDAVYDRLIEILQANKPDSDLIGRIWEESYEGENGNADLDESDDLFTKFPMYSIQTIKSYSAQALKDFADRLPKDEFDIHASFKENGWGIRIVYKEGTFYKARTRARASSGRDITPQLTEVLKKTNKYYIPKLKDYKFCEIRGELLVSFNTHGQMTQKGMTAASPFSAVSMLVRESATPDEWKMLDFVAYRFLADNTDFGTKTAEYDFLSNDLGFETPLSWTITMNPAEEDFIESLKSIISDCEAEADNGYSYYTDGVVIELDDNNLAQSLGQANGNYNNYNVAMKVGKWQQDLYTGFVQTILWVKGKTKLSPVAIVASEPDTAEFEDLDVHPYIYDIKEITNFDDLGVLTRGGNRVRRVPLYEPRNMLSLQAWRGQKVNFRYGGEAGVVPCREDGSPLIEGKVEDVLLDDTSVDEVLVEE